MKYIYGPVSSRRIGSSLGISLVSYKVCNFDCIYCQLGRTTVKTNRRKEYVKIKDILTELKEFVSAPDFRNTPVDYISLSGTGEPLLNLQIADLIKGIKEITSLPIVLITNAFFLKDEKIRQEVLGVDVIMPSLDAIDKKTFEKIDRPYGKVNLEEVIDGLINLRKEFSGKIYLEIMVIKGINDNVEDFKKFKEIIAKINPDKVQLNVPRRHTADHGVLIPEEKTLKKIKEALGDNCEIL